jgi:hypothetical protein
MLQPLRKTLSCDKVSLIMKIKSSFHLKGDALNTGITLSLNSQVVHKFDEDFYRIFIKF